MNGNYDNFNEVFFQTYDGFGTTPKSKERFYYMLQRKQFFCEAVCQRFNLDKGVKFEREVITDNFGTHGTNCFFCFNKAGKRIKLCCGGDMVVDLASEKIFFLNENEMADNQLTGKDKKNNRVGLILRKMNCLLVLMKIKKYLMFATQQITIKNCLEL